MHVTFDPTSRQGPQKQLVRVQWGSSASTHLTVTGNVLAEVSVVPPAGFSAHVGRGAVEFVASCTATFGYAEAPVAVELAELSVFQEFAEPPAVRLEWPWSSDLNAVKISMTGSVTPAFESLGGCVRLRARWAERIRDVTIPFHVERRPMMVVSPRVLYVGKERDAATVRVLASDPTLIDGLEVVASGSNGTTLLLAPKQGGTFVFDGRALHEARADSIWISTSAGDLQQVPIVHTDR